MNEWMDAFTVGRADGWMDGWMRTCIHRHEVTLDTEKVKMKAFDT